ncbi:MAG TPA: nucleotide sugar dehydrogenase, partial [Planctomycetota bacterium]|nr:nucleotide sugar dehydrogenase [Planctomycetota bacterium]
GQPDLGPLESAAHTLGQSLAPECLVLLESTTYPGTTRNVLAPILREHGRSDASRVFVAFAPERVNPGHGDPAARGAPRLVGGLTPDATRLAQAFYQSLGYAVEVTARAEVAEAAKLVENVYRAVNISLVNELKLVFAAQGIDIWEVLDAAQTKGFGFQRFDPGPGAGGSCIPIDPRYLEYFARQGGVPAQLVELAGKIDAHMAEHVVHVLERAALQTGRALQGLRVLLLGVAYKPDVNITSESPSLRVAARLLRAGAQVSYCDPEVPGPLELAPGVWQTSRVLDAATMGSTDAMVYLTDHRAFALDTIAAFPGILVDTRGKRRLRDRAAHYVSA